MADLEQKINNPDEAQRLYAVQDAESDDVTSLARILLNRLVKEPSATVRAAIAFRLKTMAFPGIYPQLFDLFRSADAYLRNAAVGIFAMGGDQASEFLSRHANDTDREVRKLILDALFEIGTDAARASIRKALLDPAVNVQVTAVEYLGQLEDIDSGRQMVDLLRKNPEPMLIMAVLDALSHLRGHDVITLALDSLAPDRDYSGIDALYLPQAMELLAICGQGPEMIQVMIALRDYALYADNLIRAASFYLNNQGKENVKEPLLAKLITLLVDESVDEEQKFMAGRMLVVHGPNRIKPEALFTLGERLLGRDVLTPVGLDLIAVSGHQDAVDRLKAFAKASRDPSLVVICQEILTGFETQ